MTAVSLMACHKPAKVTSVTTEAIAIDASLDSIQDSSYLAAIASKKADLEKQMGVQISYLADTLWVRRPECPMLNWATDALWEAAKRLCPEPVDIAIANIGGMRCDWYPGPITKGHIFELMPFDNKLVVLTLTGADILDLCQAFADLGGEGVAGLRMKAVDGRLAEVLIGGKAVDPKKNYTVATSDYLSGGADHMEALTRYTHYWDSETLIRDLYMQAAQQTDTIHAVLDGRMTLL